MRNLKSGDRLSLRGETHRPNLVAPKDGVFPLLATPMYPNDAESSSIPQVTALREVENTEIPRSTSVQLAVVLKPLGMLELVADIHTQVTRSIRRMHRRANA